MPAARLAYGVQAMNYNRGSGRPSDLGEQRRPCAPRDIPAPSREAPRALPDQRQVRDGPQKTPPPSRSGKCRFLWPWAGLAKRSVAFQSRDVAKKQVVDRGRRFLDRPDLRHELRGCKHLLRLKRISVVLV